MPFVQIKVLKGALTPEKKKEMIARVSKAVADVEASPHPGDKLLQGVWCQIEEMPPENFGAGGVPVDLERLKKAIEG